MTFIILFICLCLCVFVITVSFAIDHILGEIIEIWTTIYDMKEDE